MSFTSKIGSLASRAYGWSAAVARAVDQYFEYVTLLLPGNGTNGAQNNTFLDGSTNNFTITRNGNTTQGTFSPFSQTGWGNLFGSGNYLNTASNAAFGMGTGDFTVEAWIFATSSLTGYQAIFADGFVTNSVFFGNTAGGFGLRAGNASDILVTTAPSINQWVHVAVTRSSSTVRLLYNGTQQTTVANSTNFVTQSAYVGNDGGGSAFPGYISNLRVVKGQALYTGNFTPATSTLNVSTVGSTGAGVPTQTITGTVSLLTCQSNRFVDNGNGNSGVGFTFTRTGSPSVVAFSPFNPTASWSAATYGGSGYFDGSGDYLTVADNTALEVPTQDFTIEAWVYLTSLPSSGAGYTVIQKGRTGTSDFEYSFEIENNAGNMRLVCRTSSNGTSLTTANGNTISLATNTWYHVAVTRTTTTASFWFEGVAAGSGTVNSTTYTGTATVGLFANNAGSSPLVGYASNFRLVKGVAVYTGAFTPPTSPLAATQSAGTNISAITGTQTSLLLNFTNAGIYDATSKNDLETVGSAQISNSVTPQFGSTSIKFNGTTDYLTSIASPLTNIGSGDFTIEAWFRTASVSTQQAIVNIWGSTPTQFQLEISSAGKLQLAWAPYSTSVYAITGATTLSANTWYYVALVRSGSTFTLYLNGNSDGTINSSATTTSNAPVYIGANNSSSIGRYFNGYMQDVRITRYARTITASPTAAFPTL